MSASPHHPRSPNDVMSVLCDARPSLRALVRHGFVAGDEACALFLDPLWRADVLRAAARLP
ncbi:hypothetical protein HL658_31160 [Azospirillum sp. RWY-5-1]|uniref:Uncharacterized protein n=1 Tax=Azospirillum oleiclasticum TaxID=2735135 RepID=A0ABX2TMC2_9PROT|nr:hypothetical protein [Azospirillum oleiclasticum]NYZ17024.1 hypothetical protein [Azospirillum oleiclasticum]NYZ24532.1 hypothetical protein [Azospirillum oleiclasticum]